MNLSIEEIESVSVVAERYVKSLLSVSIKCECKNEVSSDMSSLSRLLSDDEVRKIIKRASIFKRFAFSFVKEIAHLLNLSNVTYNFLKLIVENNRLNLLKKICDCYNEFLYESSGRKKFYVTVSDSYTKSDKSSISSKIKENFSPEAECIFVNGNEIDKKFYGIKIQHKSKILDYSVEAKITRLLSTMKE